MYMYNNALCYKYTSCSSSFVQYMRPPSILALHYMNCARKYLLNGMATAVLASTTDAHVAIPACIPSDPASHATYSYAKTHLHPFILQHSIRVYLYPHSLARTDLSSLPAILPTTPKALDLFDTTQPSPRLLFLASIFHDIGTCPEHDHSQRFEVRRRSSCILPLLSKSNDCSQADFREIWTAISLHTSPGLAERMSPLTNLLRMAVKADFGAIQYHHLLDPKKLEAIKIRFPRGEIEKVLGDCVAKQAEAREGAERATKAPQVS